MSLQIAAVAFSTLCGFQEGLETPAADVPQTRSDESSGFHHSLLCQACQACLLQSLAFWLCIVAIVLLILRRCMLAETFAQVLLSGFQILHVSDSVLHQGMSCLP